ncbi:MAG: hypothetical protein ACI91B_003196 [Planctomycetota bacterium]|jgi:uncharacterized protein YjhX (UPF0386 family)
MPWQTMQRLASVVATLILASLACGQSMAWDIPHRGAHAYTRTTKQFEVTPPPSRLTSTVAIHNGKSHQPHTWKYFTCVAAKIPKNFEKPAFDDSGWFAGKSGFGPDLLANKNHRTKWANAALCARTTCDLGRVKPKALWFELDHDDGVRIWLNGELVVADDRYGVNRSFFVTGKALDAWQRGENVIAVKCSQIGGAQYLDVNLRYFDKLTRKHRKVEDLQKAIREERTAANRVKRALFGPLRPPPMLLQGELDKDRKTVWKSPADLREIAWWVAMDMRCGPLGGSIKMNATRMRELGDIKIRGRASSIDTEGWQTITATVKTAKLPNMGKDDKDYMKKSVMAFVHHSFDGKLKIRRQVEIRPTGARVMRIESDLHGTIANGAEFKNAAGTLDQKEDWLLTYTHHNQDTEFRLAVQRSIESGTKKLKEQLSKPNDTRLLNAEKPKADRSYHSGRLAIGLLALIKGGVPKDDPVLVSCLKELRKRTLIDTYTLGNALMVLEAYHQPASELSLLRSGAIDRPTKRQVPEADRALMEKWVGRLLTNIDTRVDAEYLLRFNYVGGGRYDNSLHQYGLLGLYAAHLCGVEIKPSIWEAAANHLLDDQQEDGKRIGLELMDYRTHTRMQFDPEGSYTTARMHRNANGWSYTAPGQGGGEASIWGSMTCAGITGLAICQAAILDHKKMKRKKLQNDANRARNDGFAWLAQNMTVRYHPGALTRQHRWHYYYLYSLERAALLSGVALIQDRDWYFEGALMLVLAQLENGNWPAEFTGDEQIERNAMAILFLKQSTSPVLTGK